MAIRFLLFTAASALALAAAPRAAHACSAPICVSPGYIFPATGASVPSSLDGVFWLPGARHDATIDTAQVALYRIDPTGDVRVDVSVTEWLFGYVIRPATPFAPGAMYRVEAADFCAGSGLLDETAQSSLFEAGEPAALPATLGALVASTPTIGPLTVATSSGSCSASITAAQAEITLTLAADALPWEDALMYETFVDGERWSPSAALATGRPPGESWGGRAHDLVFARCATEDPGTYAGLTEGTHVVEMRAGLAGLTWTGASTTVAVELRCSPVVAGDGGVDADGGADSDAGSSADGGVSPRDAGTAARPPSGGGCGCRVVPAPRSASAAAVALLLVGCALGASRARRRRMRRH